jgi:hypothetical protein
VAIVECIVNLALSIWLVRRWGIAGVIAGSVFAHLLTNAWYMQYGAIQVLNIPYSRIAREIGPAALLSGGTLAAVFTWTLLPRARLSPQGSLLFTLIGIAVFVSAFITIVFKASERRFVWTAASRFIANRNQHPEDFTS